MSDALGAIANGPLSLTVVGGGTIEASTISAGPSHSCAVASGGVQCWGSNGSGELGNGTTTGSSVPVGVDGLGVGSGALAVSAGGSHSCAVTSAGVKCWGSNAYGQLGNGTTGNSSVPVPVNGLGVGSAALAVSAGGTHSCAVKSSGEVMCWGYNGGGLLGIGTTTGISSVPVPVRGLGVGSATEVSAGSFHSCAVKSSGAVMCWGSNNRGQLGDGSNTNSPVPVGVVGLGALLSP